MTSLLNDDDLMGLLDGDASYFRPRLFAVCGIYRARKEPFIGWGMEFGDGDGALYYDPIERSTVHADDASGVLRLHELIADARLHYLD